RPLAPAPRGGAGGVRRGGCGDRRPRDRPPARAGTRRGEPSGRSEHHELLGRPRPDSLPRRPVPPDRADGHGPQPVLGGAEPGPAAARGLAGPTAVGRRYGPGLARPPGPFPEERPPPRPCRALTGRNSWRHL